MRILQYGVLVLGLLGAMGAQASVVGALECTADVVMVSYAQKMLSGKLANVKPVAPHTVAHCSGYDGRAVKLKVGDPAVHSIAGSLKSLTLSVEKFSSMGVGGPIAGLHWQIIAMQEEGRPPRTGIALPVTVEMAGE